MKEALWKPSEERIKNSNMKRFMTYVNGRNGMAFEDYFALYDWSVERIPDLWAAIWDFLDIKASKPFEAVADDLTKFPGARWFVGAKLNFAENLLRWRDKEIAIISKCETKPSVKIDYDSLYDTVSRVAASLRDLGVTKEDRVVAYMPNIPETAIAMLAAASIGATWASCGSELGVQAVIDRFGQIEPKVLFAVDGYLYKNKPFHLLDDVKTVVDAVPSIERVVMVPYVSEMPSVSGIRNAVLFQDFMARERREIVFEQVDANHPVYIMFSSGTTGKPKCMVQSVAGVLLNQMKELIIHADLTRDDTMIYMTAPSWMMWNWLVMGLSVGCRVVLFDGNPAYPDVGAMGRLIDEEKITFFGTSATYINHLRAQDYKLREEFSLASLKSIGQTGSPLSAEGFEYVYEQIKKDVHFNSLAGGTDINGCFAIGTPMLPVYPGELQCPALGMKIKAYNEQGIAVYDQQGELVCEAPAPSMPIYFLNDPDYTKYKDAYFRVYPHTWRHGDYITMYRQTRGVTFFGRSDAVLKPSGVRIGTAEIYNILDKFPEIADSAAIGQNWEGDQRILLFVKIAPKAVLTDELKEQINKALRDKASPRHVPSMIIEVPDIPYTFSAKKVESAITNIVNGRPVTNRDALVNPGCLQYFEKVAAELKGG
jgi:acetoacetyl-CoA synthetase